MQHRNRKNGHREDERNLKTSFIIAGFVVQKRIVDVLLSRLLLVRNRESGFGDGANDLVPIRHKRIKRDAGFGGGEVYRCVFDAGHSPYITLNPCYAGSTRHAFHGKQDADGFVGGLWIGHVFFEQRNCRMIVLFPEDHPKFRWVNGEFKQTRGFDGVRFLRFVVLYFTSNTNPNASI